MNIYLLTSSRADYGIYRPLIQKIQEHSDMNLRLIAFGSHLSDAHGHTVDEIIQDGITPYTQIKLLPAGDAAQDIANNMGGVMMEFSSFWAKEASEVDLIICLGDRFEMFAAVVPASTAGLPIAHIHGGETTLGALDNAFRHSISQFSQWHFCSTEAYKKKLEDLLDDSSNVHNVGALSLDNLENIDLLSRSELLDKLGLDDKPLVSFTFHPETVESERNANYVKTLEEVLGSLSQYHVIAGLPNMDQSNQVIRETLLRLETEHGHVTCTENLGTQVYFSLLKHAEFALGNSSSGIIEAASLDCPVVNLGDRQKGRIAGSNVIHAPIETSAILQATSQAAAMKGQTFDNPYFRGGAAEEIIKILAQLPDGEL